MNTKKTKKEWISPSGTRLASYEELEFWHWCEEAKKAGVIRTFSYQPKTFELAPAVKFSKQITLKTKVVEREFSLLNNAVYTPDFLVIADGVFDKMKHGLHAGGKCDYWIDVKGAFSMYNDDVKFSLLRKWLYDKYRIFANKVIPSDFFRLTFIPEKLRYKNNGERRTKYAACRTLDEFFKSIQPTLF